MKDRDRDDDRERERERERDRDYERENGTNGEERKGTLCCCSCVIQNNILMRDLEREEPAPVHDDLDTAE